MAGENDSVVLLIVFFWMVCCCWVSAKTWQAFFDLLHAILVGGCFTHAQHVPVARSYDHWVVKVAVITQSIFEDT